jgi:hypothetical protein
MAIAGAKAGETAAPPDAGVEYRLKRLGARSARRRRRTIAIMAAVALLAVGGVALASLKRPGGPTGRAGAAPSRAPAKLHAPGRPSAVPARAAPTASARRAPSRKGSGHAGALEVVGVGCPSDGDDTITLDNASTSPGWMPAGGGWTGNGCDGSTLWTMDPNGGPAPSTLTWRFSPAAGATWCALAVFVPTQNALGVSDYWVSTDPAGIGHVVATVPVSQAANDGQWLRLGTFPAHGSPLEITTAPVPGASGPGHHGAVAASAASARCK